MFTIKNINSFIITQNSNLTEIDLERLFPGFRVFNIKKKKLFEFQEIYNAMIWFLKSSEKIH